MRPRSCDSLGISGPGIGIGSDGKKLSDGVLLGLACLSCECDACMQGSSAICILCSERERDLPTKMLRGGRDLVPNVWMLATTLAYQHMKDDDRGQALATNPNGRVFHMEDVLRSKTPIIDRYDPDFLLSIVSHVDFILDTMVGGGIENDTDTLSNFKCDFGVFKQRFHHFLFIFKTFMGHLTHIFREVLETKRLGVQDFKHVWITFCNLHTQIFNEREKLESGQHEKYAHFILIYSLTKTLSNWVRCDYLEFMLSFCEQGYGKHAKEEFYKFVKTIVEADLAIKIHDVKELSKPDRIVLKDELTIGNSSRHLIFNPLYFASWIEYVISNSDEHKGLHRFLSVEKTKKSEKHVHQGDLELDRAHSLVECLSNYFKDQKLEHVVSILNYSIKQLLNSLNYNQALKNIKVVVDTIDTYKRFLVVLLNGRTPSKGSTNKTDISIFSQNFNNSIICTLFFCISHENGSGSVSYVLKSMDVDIADTLLFLNFIIVTFAGNKNVNLCRFTHVEECMLEECIWKEDSGLLPMMPASPEDKSRMFNGVKRLLGDSNLGNSIWSEKLPEVSRMEFVLTKTCILISRRLKSFCYCLKITDWVKTCSWRLIVFVLFHEINMKLFVNNHINVIIACSIYGLCKIFDKEMTFKKILESRPARENDVYRNIILDGKVKIDIVKFYNTIFLKRTKPLLLTFALSQSQTHTLPLVPWPKDTLMDKNLPDNVTLSIVTLSDGYTQTKKRKFVKYILREDYRFKKE